MDQLQNLQSRIAHLIDSIGNPRDAQELDVVRRQLDALFSEQVAVQKENRRILAENMSLTSKNRLLMQQLERMKMESAQPSQAAEEPSEIIEYLGVLFTRKANGRFLRTVFCPKCRRSMRAVSSLLPFTCSNCKLSTSFKAAEINDVIIQLERS